LHHDILLYKWTDYRKIILLENVIMQDLTLKDEGRKTDSTDQPDLTYRTY
jgi:hypothetical protein